MSEKKVWTHISVSISTQDIQSILIDIETIAKRERKSRSAIIVEAMREYSIYHLKGNYQTVMDSYEADGEGNRASIEREIRDFFKIRASKGIEIKLREIKARCNDHLSDSKTVIAMAERVYIWLREQGVVVWR